MNAQIKDSVVFVTGSNRGIGKAIVEELVKSGARKVYAGARNAETLKALVASSNGKVVAVTLDVTNEDQIQAAAETAQDTQILINNAGIANYTAIIAASDTRSVRQEMEVNFFGVMNMTRAFAPILKKNGGGVLVNISSVAGLVGVPLLEPMPQVKPRCIL
jgi:NAD(P)-dependent dehydrogenase (short-subunit alcohol dehydrogenase family)